MTSYAPIVKNGANGAIFYVSLAPRTANGQWQANPTLASGDVKISLDGGALANLNTLPVVAPAGSKIVKVVLSQAETNADNIAILFSDAAGAEWCDLTINLQTAAKQFDDLATQSDLTAVKDKTDSLNFTVSGQVDANVTNWKGAAAAAMTGDAYARLGAPAGASVSADVAAVKSDSGGIKTKTDSLSFSVAGVVDSNVVDWKGSTAPANTGDAFARLGAPAGASVSADVAAIKSDTGNIGTAGAGLTALGDSRLAHLDADVSSRSTYAGGDTSGTTTLLSRLTSTRAGLLDHLDADISSRMATFSYTAPLDAAGTRSAVGLASANLDTQIATLATGATASAIKAKTDNLPSDPASASIVASEITAVQNHGDTYWLTATGFATSAALSTVSGNVDGIKGVTDSLVMTNGKLWVLDEQGNPLPHTSDISTIESAIGALPVATDNATAVLAATYEGSETVQAHLRLTRAALLGKANGLDGSTVHFRDAADTKDRITATVDTDGNRLAVTTDAT